METFFNYLQRSYFLSKIKNLKMLPLGIFFLFMILVCAPTVNTDSPIYYDVHSACHNECAKECARHPGFEDQCWPHCMKYCLDYAAQKGIGTECTGKGC